MDNIELTTFHFGPLLTLCNIKDNLRKEMLDVGLKNSKDWRQHLAGRIDNEKSYTIADIQYFSKKLEPYFAAYFNKLVNRPPNINLTIRPYTYSLDSLWINVQKENEYNPIHHHSGDISFVIYLDISDEIYKEENIATSIQNGAIQFIEGFDQDYFGKLNSDYQNIRRVLIPNTSYTHMPVIGEMFIFPSYLSHHVASFKTPGCRRVSVSGNVNISEVSFDNKGSLVWQDVVN